MNIKYTVVGLVAAGLVLGGGAAALAGGGDDEPKRPVSAGLVSGPASAAPDSPQPDSPQPRSPEPSEKSGTSKAATAAEAAEVAVRETGGIVESVELDDGRWEIDLLARDGKWRELKVDRSGKVLSNRPDDDDDDDDARELRAMKLTAAQAARLAGERGTVTEIEFDDRGWEVELRTGRELWIDRDGKITVDDD